MVLMDNFALCYIVNSEGDIITNYIAGYIYPIMFAIAMLVVLIGMVFSGNMTPQNMIALLVATIVGFVALMILTTL
jgi:hypothetical protein